MLFDGNDDDAIIPINSTAWPSTGDFSICFWAAPVNGSDVDWYFGQTTGKTTALTFQHDSFSKFRFRISFSNLNAVDLQTVAMSRLTNNQWYHFAIVVDRSSASNSKIYIDGNAASMDTQTVDATADININNDLYIARNTATSQDSGSKNMKCADFAIFSEAIPEKLIKKMHRAKCRLDLTRGKFSKELVCYYRPGISNSDFSGNLGDLTVSGATIGQGHP
tara:strand:+ start:720 stop:1382 length:663 start_codon:yes stop_codon:yes gene_type:complete